MSYVDGYVIPVPKENLAAYRRMAARAARVWKDHGALDYREFVGEDLDVGFGMPFPRALGVRPGETVVFAWIIFRSRAHRDRVNARAVKDPRLADSMDPERMPFDPKRMVYGGFKALVKSP